MDNLVIRDGLYFKKFTDVPFIGEVTGKQQGLFKDGKKEGPWVRYHDNGQLREKGTFKDGTAPRCRWRTSARQGTIRVDRNLA